MTASNILLDASYSKFTFALLEDSGWYKPIYSNLDKMKWGYKKGCNFLLSCNPQSFDEFFDSNDKNYYCDFHHNAIGSPGKDSFSEDCFYLRAYSNT